MRRRFRDWAFHLHQRTDPASFTHNCIAHPLWWLGETITYSTTRMEG